MNQRALRILEYDKITALLAAQATSDPGRELCARLLPMTDIDEIRLAQTETADALGRIFSYGGISFSGIKDPGYQVKRLEIGGALGLDELLMIASLLEVAKRAKNYARQTKPEESADSLTDMFGGIEPLEDLLNEIRRCIPGPDEVSDAASPTLANIRRKIRNVGDKVHTTMNSLLNNSTIRTYLQDAVITMRGDRYCLPVRAECKGKVPGLIHDQSSSGSTLFIEPMAVVNLNNDLKELLLKEQEEIDKILADLSSRAAEHTAAITADYRILRQLDFIFAKANLAKIQNAMPPIFNCEGRINIRKGRHPLLDGHKVVPIDIRLGEDFTLLVITGPNTGGKTVSLKTVGLLTLMGQSGLHIPAGDRSELSVFKQIYADIGDEQSIEQNLSTFSSHMTNIVHILKKANRGSLVLFDELCAGTDPDEGAALAISILDKLRRRGIRTISTTHYSEIKLYALSTEGVENACCEFDVETLSPTYHLLIGIPGKSNAFAISEKLGLSPGLIEDAKSRLSTESESFEDVIADLEIRRRDMEQTQADIKRYKAEAEELKTKLEKDKEKLAQNRDRIIREANEEAANILKEAKDAADAAISNFRKYGKSTNADSAAMERERDNIRKKMTEARSKAGIPKAEPAENTKAPTTLRLGDRVRILSLNLNGTVHSLPDAKGNLYVQAGILKYQANIKDLVLIDEDLTPKAPAAKGTSGLGQIKMSKSLSVSPEINLIGKTVDEAIQALDKYLDDAYLAHLKSVRIVHGKGTGALRNAVQNHLRRQKYIEEYHLGEFGEGDSGVTVATFK